MPKHPLWIIKCTQQHAALTRQVLYFKFHSFSYRVTVVIMWLRFYRSTEKKFSIMSLKCSEYGSFLFAKQPFFTLKNPYSLERLRQSAYFPLFLFNVFSEWREGGENAGNFLHQTSTFLILYSKEKEEK